MSRKLLFVGRSFKDRAQIAFRIQLAGQPADQFVEIERRAARSLSVEYEGQNRAAFLVAGPSARLLLGPVDLIGLVVVGFQPVEIALDSLSQFASYGHAVETGRSERLGLRAGSAAGQQTCASEQSGEARRVFSHGSIVLGSWFGYRVIRF